MKPIIDQAKEFILNSVDNPALAHPDLPREIKNKVINSKTNINKFKKVGDLNDYLSRFKFDVNKEVYTAFKKLNLTAYEDIVYEFENKFSSYIEDRMNLNYFEIGKNYTAWDLSVCAKTYYEQQGIYNVKDDKNNSLAVIIKVNFEDGPYPNNWLEKNKTLKYYLQTKKGKDKKADGTEYKSNDAIKKGDLPIYVFEKDKANSYEYMGIFKTVEIKSDANGRYFILEKNNPYNLEDFDATSNSVVVEELGMSYEDLKNKINTSPKIPNKVTVSTTHYERNKYVKIAVFKRANGICELCKREAPFKSKKNSLPYLEIHHKIFLSQGGEDTVENAIAVCPNCHRFLHHGDDENYLSK